MGNDLKPGRRFIGCATDQAFVIPTCALLSSIDDNGGVPDATVIVADFGLTENDRWLIRRAAGRLGAGLRFMPVTRDHEAIVALPDYDFPFPLIGRLIMPGTIDVPRARLITIDSDMIVNKSLVPLFDTAMRGHAVAAIQDPLAVRHHYDREPNPSYLNAGLMLIDVERFNQQQIGQRAMLQWAGYAQRPRFLDQDALNDVLEGDWFRLDRSWNFFHAADPEPFTLRDYQAANIVHYAGGKPWDCPDHAGGAIYWHHAAAAADKVRYQPPRNPGGGITRDFAASCHEILLGREMEDERVFEDGAHLSQSGYLGAILGSPEFRQGVLDPLLQGHTALRGNALPPSIRQKYFIIDKLPVCANTAEKIEDARAWGDLLGALVQDRHFMLAGNLSPIDLTAYVDAPLPAHDAEDHLVSAAPVSPAAP